MAGESGPIAVATSNGKVGASTFEVRDLRRRINLDNDVRMGAPETPELLREPAMSEGRSRAYFQTAGR